MASLFGLVFLVIALLVVVGLIVGIVLWATSKGGGSSEMSCGGCGYVVRGLSQLNCPECGADLREVGIGRGASAGKRTTGIVLTVCCGSLLLLGCGSSALMVLGLRKVSAPSTPIMQTMPAPSANSASVTQNQNGSTTITNPDGSTITTHPDGSTTSVQADGTTTTYDVNGVEIQTPENGDSPAP